MENQIKTWRIVLKLILISICLSCDNDKKIDTEVKDIIQIKEQGSFNSVVR